MSQAIQALVMPKWGLAMQEGTLTAWQVAEGEHIEAGQEICDIETSKIASPLESSLSGTLARQVADEGATLPVGALMAVVTDGTVDAAQIDAFIENFQANFAASAAEAAAAAPSAQQLELAGTSVNYLKLGESGTPLILIHGFGGDLNTWMFNQQELAESCATYALELPGHGASSKRLTDDTSVAGLAALVAAFMDALDIPQAHLAGHSLGGAVALQLALSEPQRCASLSLICPAGLGPEINRDYIDGFIQASSRKQLKPHLQILFHDPELVNRDMINEVLKFKRLDGVTAALSGIADTVFPGAQQATVLRERLGELHMPVQVIVGGSDRIIPPTHADGLPDAITVHRLENAGHMPHLEAATEVNRWLAGMLGR